MDKTKPVELFYSYAHEDEHFRTELQKHLKVLERNGIINGWHDRKIIAGEPFDDAISKHIREAEIVLLLVSASFLNSDYCWDKEVKCALDRHHAKEAKVIPVILRPCRWSDDATPIGRLLALPKDGKPINTWENVDQAFLNVVEGIEVAAKEIAAHPTRARRK